MAAAEMSGFGANSSQPGVGSNSKFV